MIVLLAITMVSALDHMEELQQDIELASANTPKADAPGVGAAQIADAIKKDKDDVKAGKIDKATAEKQAKKLLARFESVQIENAVKKAQDTINKAGGTDADAEKAATMIKQGLAAASNLIVPSLNPCRLSFGHHDVNFFLFPLGTHPSVHLSSICRSIGRYQSLCSTHLTVRTVCPFTQVRAASLTKLLFDRRQRSFLPSSKAARSRTLSRRRRMWSHS